MASKRETSGATERATSRRRPGGERPNAASTTARPGAGPRLAKGDLPVAELGGGAVVGAVVGRLVGGGLRGAALGAALGAAAGTAVGLVTGGLLGEIATEPETGPREPAFGPRVDPQKRTAPVSPAGPPRAAEARGEVAEARGEAAEGREHATDSEEETGSEEGTGSEAPDYASWTKAELYEEAKSREIEGRSTMTKAELVAALRRATFHT